LSESYAPEHRRAAVRTSRPIRVNHAPVGKHTDRRPQAGERQLRIDDVLDAR
jgi:hypothetical protein